MSLKISLRDSYIKNLGYGCFDVLVIGGGINGSVAAAALSARGAKVALVDQGDFASCTSQNSSNLVWGGIKYMESYEFPLVRKLCKSRNHLLSSYPSAVKEIRFYTNLDKGFRHSSRILYFATMLYWVIGNFFTRAPRFLTPKKINIEEPLINTSNSIGGVEYSDAYLYDNDARFVFNFISSALENNCIAVNYVESKGSKQNTNGEWLTKLRNNRNNEEFEIRSKIIINACGPYVDQQNKISDQTSAHHHVFSKGIHLIVPRITEKERVLTFFADDGRMFFAIPMGGKTMIGTTDTPVSTPETKVTKQDLQFVLDNINKRLNLPKPISEKDVISERCGVRPLVLSNEKNNHPYEDWTKLSRKHEIDINPKNTYISIFGGKLTDCINIGEEICEKVERLGISLPNKKLKWYGEPEKLKRKEYFDMAKSMKLEELTSSSAPEILSSRLWRRYGNRAFGLLENIKKDPKMAEPLIEGTDYIKCELDEAAEREMIVTLEDFLRRRSMLALILTNEDLKKSYGLREACKILFAEDAAERWEEYFGERF